ncbi:MAG: hypothetical protein EXR27_16560 [Betaproteobacteria bacterium]|nr:hypothetical protein [Betaproteobacteria bacterium]
MDFNDDKHLDVCENIEIGLKREYERNPCMTDSLCILALENAKIAAKQQFGYARNESVSKVEEIQGIIGWCVAIARERVGKVNDLTLVEFNARIEKIRRSVKLHSGAGSRSYFEFIRQYIA